MKIKHLIAKLQKEDPERLVVLARDSEWNGFSPLGALDRGAYHAESRWNGSIGLDKLTAADRRAGYTDEDVDPGGVPALVLSPKN